MQLSLIDPAAFGDGFNLATFLSGIAKEVLDPKVVPAGPKPDTSTAAAAARVSLDKSRALLELLDKAEAEAVYAHGEVAKSASSLQTSLSADQAKYQKSLSSCERHSERVRESFRRLEERSNRVGQVGTRLGDRLQRADALRSRALELVKLFEYLALFAVLPEGDGAFVDGLPGTFWEDRKLGEAATIARKLRALTSEAESARERSRLAGAAAAEEDAARRASGAAAAPDGGAGAGAGAGEGGGGGGGALGSPLVRGGAGPVGSLDYCTRRLGQYCVWLESRVVGRFDQAVDDDNPRVMGECARIMAAFDREKAIIQRYISLLPAFQSSVDDIPWVRDPAVASDDAVVSERLRPLSRLYGTLGEMVAIEAGRMATIFPSVRTALQMLATKVFEDRVRMALERLLEDTAEDAFSRSTSFSSGRPLDELRHDESYGSDDGGGGGGYSDGDYDDSSADEYDSGDGSGSDDDSGSGSGGQPPGARRGRPPPPASASAKPSATKPPPAAAAAASTTRKLPPAAAGSGRTTLLPSMTMRTAHPSFLSLRQRPGRRSTSAGGGIPRRGSAAAAFRPSSTSGTSGTSGMAVGGGGRDRHGDDDDAASSGGPSVLALHLYLRLLAGAYVRTGELAEQVEAATSGQVDVAALVDSIFEQFTKLYPAPELQWLDMMAEKEMSPDFDSADPRHRPELTLPAAEALIRRNVEAVQRCTLLCPPSQTAAAVRLLYVGEAPYDGTMPGSLMEHLPRYLTDGVEREMELTLQLDSRGGSAACNVYRLPYQPPAPPGSKGPPPPLQMPPPITRAFATQAAQSYVVNRVAPVLRSVHNCTRVVQRLQEHHTKVILPALDGSAPEVSACANGLATGLRSVEAAVLSVMQALVDMFVIQAEKVLMYEQRRSEFMPPEGQLDAAVIDRPTDACLLVTALLEALAKVCREALDGSNLSSFLLDVGCRMHATFLNHMQQFVYNAAGALRWRNDVAAYCEVLRSWGLPLLDSRMGSVGGLVGILVVEPEQLLPLINGTLRMDHREAIKYVRLRHDFHVARVQGRSLQQIFGSEDVVPGQGAAAGPGQQRLAAGGGTGAGGRR